MKNMLLELKNIVVHYARAEALKGVSINVDEGEIVTIIGPNGAGKTTTLKTIAALNHPTSGEIWFDGDRIDKLPPDKMIERGIGFCMEGRRLFPFMTVLENLQMGAFSRRDKDKIGHDLESTFNRFPALRERKEQKAGTLSGGEQQMLTIGRALMSRPKLLLLDEPSLGLAPMIVASLAKTIKELNAAGLTILLVEQNARMALRVGHRGYVLEVGKIILEGDCQSLSKDKRVKQAYLGI
jgi:branched-chain amino acid transport system ATP-binding protein